MGPVRAGAFLTACGIFGLYLGYIAAAILASALTAPPGATWAPSGRDMTNFAGDVESWLRGEGY